MGALAVSIVREKADQIIRSLAMKPCTIDELCERDFLKFYDRYLVDMCIIRLEKEDKIYYRGEKIFAKKWAINSLEE